MKRPKHKRLPLKYPAAAFLKGDNSKLSCNAYVIKAGGTKWGPRDWGRREFAQVAIAALFPNNLPKHVNQSKLCRDVNAVLAKDNDFKNSGYEPLKRNTVVRALNDLRAKNR